MPAYDGDSFIISFGKNEHVKNILIDGGRRKKVINKLKEEIEIIKNKNQFIDLLVLTHIDEDHIQGLIKIFQDDKVDKTIIKKVWFNSKEILSKHFLGKEEEDDFLRITKKTDDKISFLQGISFGKLLDDLGLSSKQLIHSGQELKIGEALIKVLSPDLIQLENLLKQWDKAFKKEKVSGKKIADSSSNDHNKSIKEISLNEFKEDNAAVNGSSIAFSIEYEGYSLLMLGDSFPSVVAKNLKKISGDNQGEVYFNCVKISHHGSKYNTSDELLNVLHCNHFLISTNGKTHGFPNKETLVRIAFSRRGEASKKYFYFNYADYYENIFREGEKDILNIKCIDVEEKAINILELK